MKIQIAKFLVLSLIVILSHNATADGACDPELPAGMQHDCTPLDPPTPETTSYTNITNNKACMNQKISQFTLARTIDGWGADLLKDKKSITPKWVAKIREEYPVSTPTDKKRKALEDKEDEYDYWARAGYPGYGEKSQEIHDKLKKNYTRDEFVQALDQCMKAISKEPWVEEDQTREKMKVLYDVLNLDFGREMRNSKALPQPTLDGATAKKD